MNTGAYRLAPWSSVARPHADVVGGALDMGTYAVNLARVFRGAPGVPEVYLRADRFFATTYLTEGLRSLLTDVMAVLAGGVGDRVLQLRTPFGGGKTHTLVALLHLARSRNEARGITELSGLADPGQIDVAVLSGEELDPLNPREAAPGITTRTLWGELGAQLGHYDAVARNDEEGAAPGGDTLREVLGDGPVLVLLDEVLVYVEKAMAVQRGESTLGRQAMLFVQALTEAINSHPRAAMVYSLQASVGEAVGAEGLLTQLDHLVSRVDAKREPVTGDEVMRVIQRRLFEHLGDSAVQAEVARAYADVVRRQLVAQAETLENRREAETEAARLEDRIRTSYPFHPGLLDLMYHRWGTLPSYQRTRGALQFLACVTHALWERGDDSLLIGPGEVDLGDEATRGAFFSQVGERERYTAVLDSDITSAGSGAAIVDRRIGADAPALAQLRVGTHMATAIMLYSFGAREGEERGVLESDLVTTSLVPGLDRNNIVAALHDLRDEELYLHHASRRYRFEPTPNLTKMVRDEGNRLGPDEVLAAVRAELERALVDARHVALWPAGPSGIRDRVPAFTVVYLHPDWNPEQAPVTSFVEQAQGGKRTFRNAIGFVLPDSPQFDRARAAARLRLAADNLLKRKSQFGFSGEQVDELKEKSASASRDLGATVAQAYGKVSVPVKATSGDAPFAIEEIDLRSLLSAGRTLQQRVMEALSHRVFDKLTVDKLVDLSGLGRERPLVRCSDLVDWFFSYFEFTKLTGSIAITDAISRGIMDGKVAYATGITEAGDDVVVRDPRLVRRNGLVPTSEIDLGPEAWLLTPEVATRLTPPPPNAEASDSASPAAGPAVASGDELPAAAMPLLPAQPGDTVKRVVLSFTVGADGLFSLNRALAWLRDEASGLFVDITVEADAKGDGMDPIRLRNGVIEPLEEAEATFRRQELT